MTTQNTDELCRRLGKAIEIADGLEPEMSDPFHCAVARVRALVAELAGEGTPIEPRPMRLGWLEKDFVALYTAASATIDISTLAQTRAVREALVAQLERLRPAFETLTFELRQRDARLDALVDAADKSPVQGLIHKLARAIAIDTATAEQGGHPCGPSGEGPMPHAVTSAIIDDPVHVDAADVAVAGTWIQWAMRGAALGWHAAHAHPGEVASLARSAAPLDEPHRAAWQHGYRLGAHEAEVRGRAELGRRGLDVEAMNRGRAARNMPPLTAAAAVAQLDRAAPAVSDRGAGDDEARARAELQRLGVDFEATNRARERAGLEPFKTATAALSAWQWRGVSVAVEVKS